MNSIKVCEYSRSRSFHDDLIHVLQDQASGERSQDQWSSGLSFFSQFELTHFLGHFSEWIEGTLCAQLLVQFKDVRCQ